MHGDLTHNMIELISGVQICVQVQEMAEGCTHLQL